MKIVQGHPGLVRSEQGTIININGNEMAQARKRKFVWRQQQEDLEALKSDVKQMKYALNKLLEDRDGSH